VALGLSRTRVVLEVVLTSVALVLVGVAAAAQEPAGERISGYSGGFSQTVALDVPAFHGVEPVNDEGVQRNLLLYDVRIRGQSQTQAKPPAAGPAAQFKF